MQLNRETKDSSTVLDLFTDIMITVQRDTHPEKKLSTLLLHRAKR